jgi:peptidoglycan hydrolase CwlO-like protein
MGIWDKVQRGVGRAAEEAEKQAALAKLGLDINATNGDIRKKTAELGERVLKLARSGDLEHAVIGPLVAEIDSLEAKVAELEKQLTETRAAPVAGG